MDKIGYRYPRGESALRVQGHVVVLLVPLRECACALRARTAPRLACEGSPVQAHGMHAQRGAWLAERRGTLIVNAT